MHPPEQGAAGEKVAGPSSQLSRRRPGQHEPPVAAVLHEEVNLVEQLGSPLDLVQNDPAGLLLRLDLAAQEHRILLVLERGGRRQEIDRLRVRKAGS
jgi:hypothetical protein